MSAATIDVHVAAEECCCMGVPRAWALACRSSSPSASRVNALSQITSAKGKKARQHAIILWQSYLKEIAPDTCTTS